MLKMFLPQQNIHRCIWEKIYVTIYSVTLFECLAMLMTTTTGKIKELFKLWISFDLESNERTKICLENQKKMLLLSIHFQMLHAINYISHFISDTNHEFTAIWYDEWSVKRHEIYFPVRASFLILPKKIKMQHFFSGINSVENSRQMQFALNLANESIYTENRSTATSFMHRNFLLLMQCTNLGIFFRNDFDIKCAAKKCDSMKRSQFSVTSSNN